MQKGDFCKDNIKFVLLKKSKDKELFLLSLYQVLFCDKKPSVPPPNQHFRSVEIRVEY